MKKLCQVLEVNLKNNMIQVIYRKLTTKILHVGFVILLTCTASVSAQEGDPVKGKALFNTNCAACHALDRKMTGPALRHTERNLIENEGLDREWLYAWIKNSAAMVKAGDPYAVKIFEEYDGAAMTAFPQLSNEDIDDILAYTEQDKPAPVVAETAVATDGAVVTSGSISNEIILGALAILFALLGAGLFIVNRTLRRFAAAQNIEIPVAKPKRTPLWKAFLQNQFLMIVVAIFFLLGSAYFAYGYFMQVGIDQGYEPVQPIHFSHRIHAGDNEVDCNYCHSSARASKHSGIPSLNVCMNCHKSIYEVAPETLAEGKELGVDYNAEIQKLYDAVGWDDEEQEYTGETQPVKWVRIHNLPDFVYFNHSQHVTVAGIECQTCHGPVEEMEIMYQHSSLTMGWCIDCHRTSEVDMGDNAYYTKIHAELTKKYGVEELTVAMQGGLECGKCHY